MFHNIIYMIDNTLPNVPLKNSAQSFVLENTLIQSIVAKIKLIPGYDQLKNDIEITEHICNLVENTILKNKGSKPVDKKQIVVKIVSVIFNLSSDSEKKVIEHQIDYLFNNNMIMKIPIITKILRWIQNALTKSIS